MAKLDSLIICEDIQNIIDSSNGNSFPRPQIIGPLDIISPYSVPGNYSFAIFGSISEVANGTDSKLCITISSPQGVELFKSGELLIKNPDNKFPTIKFSFNFRNFLFPENGKYRLDVNVDGNKIDSRDIYVQAQNKV